MNNLLRILKKEKAKPFDKYLFSIVLIITIFGLLAFVSASLGILAKDEGKFYSVLFNQIVLGLVCGSIVLFLTSIIPYQFWRKNAFFIFLGTIILTLLVFTPLGFEHGGARRWISVAGVSIQPAELLKIGTIIYLSAWLAWTKRKKEELKYRIIPLAIILGLVGSTLIFQPDTKSLILIVVASCSMFFVSGISWKRMIIFACVLLVGFAIIVLARPYVMNRVKTFLNPSQDSQGASWQLQQSLIAIGSGGIFGRGLGQSVQKFNYLPEPQGDSIFAVIGEEFGFIGSSILVTLYIFLALRGFKIAQKAPDVFGKYLVMGLITLLTAQSFMNILSLIGLFPLTGVPLVFVSHGGTSFMIALASIGIILNVSRSIKA